MKIVNSDNKNESAIGFRMHRCHRITRWRWEIRNIALILKSLRLILVLMSASLRDPFVGFDVLIGTFFGLAAAMVRLLSDLIKFRCGLLAMVANAYAAELLSLVPITTNFSTWYAGSRIATLFALLVMTALAFHTSLGGQKVFAGNLPGD